MQSIGFAAKVLALLVSFAGLCGMIRRWTKLDGTSAPLVTVSLITVVMMLGGGALYGIWWVLYLGGFLGFLWHYLIRRSKPDLTAVVTLGAALAFVCLRFPGAYFTGNDSVSHWGLAAKFLLRENRFPDGAQELIYFPSYPLGEGVYLYYVCRSLGSRPDLYMAGLFMLYVVALLPVMGLAGEKKPLGPVLGALTMIYLLCCNTFSLSLQVDALIGYLAIGGTLIVCREHDSPRKLAALGVIAMLTLVKTSGIFYAVVLAALLGLSSDKKTRLRSLLAGLGVAALAFALWQLHVKLNFGAVTGKHAVSVAR